MAIRFPSQLPLLIKGSLCAPQGILGNNKNDLIRPPGTFTLQSNCRWQLFDLNSLRGAPPSQGKAWGTDCHTSLRYIMV